MKEVDNVNMVDMDNMARKDNWNLWDRMKLGVVVVLVKREVLPQVNRYAEVTGRREIQQEH